MEKTMRATTRSLTMLMLFLAIGGAILLAGVGTLAAQDTNLAEQRRGPAELFVDLPTEGLYEGVFPDTFYKAVLLRVPNTGGADLPELDLPRWAQYAAGGLKLVLEQQLEYMPHLFGESDVRRVRRFDSWLYSRPVPRAGDDVPEGPVPDLEDLCRRLNTTYLFLLSFVPGEGDESPQAGVYRYRAGMGYQVYESFELHRPGRPEPDSLIRKFEEVAQKVTHLAGATTDDEGNAVAVPHAPVPRLVKADRSLRYFVELRENLETGQIEDAWISWEDLREREPEAGRAALWGMEVFRGMSDAQTDPEQHERYRQRSVQVGIDALKHVPNDVLLRGRLAWNVYTFYNRLEWSLEGLRQAMVVQPGNLELINWVKMVRFWWEEDRIVQARWLEENYVKRITDGRVELAIGHVYYGSGDYAGGVRWYSRAVERMPGDYEANLSLGLCGSFHGDWTRRGNLPGEQGRIAREAAAEIYEMAARHLWKAITIDPLEVEYAYEYFARVSTHNFTWLPTDVTQLDRIFLIQAVQTGLTRHSRTFQFDRLVERIRATQVRVIREDARDAKPGDELYEIYVLARLQFALTSGNNREVIRTLHEMRYQGLRPATYVNAMLVYGPLVEDYNPDAEDSDSDE